MRPLHGLGVDRYDRSTELQSWDSDWVERIEFGCRECGAAWD